MGVEECMASNLAANCLPRVSYREQSFTGSLLPIAPLFLFCVWIVKAWRVDRF